MGVLRFLPLGTSLFPVLVECPTRQPGFGRTPGLISNPKISEMMLEMLKIDAPPERGLMLSGV